MLKILKGHNIFECPFVDIVVNPVNCVGVSGKGLALEFKKRYPDNFKRYKAYCDVGKMHPGDSFVTRQGSIFVVNFATKNHWKNPSRLEWIEDGLARLHQRLLSSKKPVSGIVFPMLGAGLGGLKRDDVINLFEDEFVTSLINVYLCV